jgi:iron(III) transport system substrate-binding protein
VLYTSADQAVAEPIIARFEKESGIRVLSRFDTEATKTAGLVQRIRAERSRPTCDVFWSSEVFHTIRLAEEGLLGSYMGEEVNGWPRYLADSEGRWYGFGMRARVIGYNTKAVAEGEAPRRLEDVLDGRWKGRVVMARPEFGTTSGDVASWFVHYGEVRAREILAGLKANDVRLVDGNSTAVRMVATGQADVCFTDTDDIYAGIRNGWPIGMNYLDQGGDGALSIPNTAALIKGGPNGRNAEALMAFLLGEEAEEMLVLSDGHNSPVHGGLAERYKEYAIDMPLEIDYGEVAGMLPTAIEEARETLR